MLQHPDTLYLQAAIGWLELGNHLEANEELEKITPSLRAHPDVLVVRWQIYAKAEKWEGAFEIARTLVQKGSGVTNGVFRSFPFGSCALAIATPERHTSATRNVRPFRATQVESKHRHPPILESPPGAEVVIDGQRYLYFAGTSYLGLAGHPEVIEAACEATRRYGVHAATSRASYGNSPATLEVERLAAQFFGTDDAFYFVSGYVGNHIIIQALARDFDAVMIDGASHYCVSEAAQLSGVPIIPFRHRDPEDLRNCLQRGLRPGQRPLVMTDGVFPMTGALAPIADYIQTLQRHSPAAVLIDDAHGLGVIGANGRGSLEQAGLWGPEVNAGTPAQGVGLYICGTMSKAMGGFGGIVPGAGEFVNRARSSSHYFDGASAPPSAAAGATAKALELILREPQWRGRLQENIRRTRGGLRKLGLEVENWPTPNIGLQIGNADNMRRIHEGLKARSILVPYFGSYSGTGTDGLLRIAVFATHTAEAIDHLLTEMSKLV